MRFSRYVQSLRTKRGITQKQLAEMLGFTPQAISRFESLDSHFDLTLLESLCKALDCSVLDMDQRNVDSPQYEFIPMDLNAISTRIKSLREEKNLTQEALSASAKITVRSLRTYEKGEALPSYQTLELLSDALGVKPHELMMIPEAPKKEGRRPKRKRIR